MSFWGRLIGRRTSEPAETREQYLAVNPYAFGDSVIALESADSLSSFNMLSIPAVWTAVDFLSGNLAALPLRVHAQGDHSEVASGRESQIVSQAPAAGFTSFDWRYTMWKNLFTYGRAFTYIERAPMSGTLRRLHWNMNPNSVQAKLVDGKLEYTYTDPKGTVKTWRARDVIDIAWMIGGDGVEHISPAVAHYKTFKMAFEFEQYQSKFARTGGVPPFMAKARWDSVTAVKSGIREILTSIRLANKRGEMVIPVGKDVELQPLGVPPGQGRIVESQQFIVRQIARIYGLPPIYLHDTDRMTYSNAEHQGLNLTKFTFNRWCTQLEAQLTQKLLGPNREARHDMDGLLRGDYMSRVQGHSTAIMSGQLTPNEARAAEDRAPLDHGDQLFIQSGTAPIENLMMEGEGNGQSNGIPGPGNPGGDDSGDRHD